MDKNGHYELNFTGLAPLGADAGNYYRQIDEEKPEPYSDSNLTFPYYGNTFETAHLSSNGYITFGGLAVDSQGTFREIFEAGYPRISAFFAPLAPENISMINAVSPTRLPTLVFTRRLHPSPSSVAFTAPTP